MLHKIKYLTFYNQLYNYKQLCFLVSLIFISLAIFNPFSPSMPQAGLDDSWAYGLNEATAQGLRFGKDIVFTFGPYASIFTSSYHPGTDKLMILGSLYFGIFFAISSYLNFMHSGWRIQLSLLLILGGLTYSKDALFLFYPLLAGTQTYTRINSNNHHRLNSAGTGAIMVVIFAPLGLLPIIKGSSLIASTITVCLSVLMLFHKRHYLLCIIALITPIMSMSAFWMFAGQPLNELPRYLFSVVTIISGYTEAMGNVSNLRECIAYILASSFLIIVLFSDLKGFFGDRILLTLLFLSIIFLGFKAGFVRHDTHAIIASALILLVSILAASLTSNRNAFIIVIVSLIAMVYISYSYSPTYSHSLYINFKNRYLGIWSSIDQRLSNPNSLKKKYDDQLAKLQKAANIPHLDGTTDVYSYDQTLLIASGNKWNPRPTFQSYQAYTPDLSQKNKLHLLSDRRPDNIILKIQPIDGNLPSIDDGASWPALLSLYEPTLFSNGYLYLKYRNNNENLISLNKISNGYYSLGSQINVPKSHEIIFVKIFPEKSFLGKILNLIFKISDLNITVNIENGKVHRFRIISGSAESGFILSPLVLNTNEFRLLYSGIGQLEDEKVKSIQIDALSYPWHWKNSFEIEFFSLSN